MTAYTSGDYRLLATIQVNAVLSEERAGCDRPPHAGPNLEVHAWCVHVTGCAFHGDALTRLHLLSSMDQQLVQVAVQREQMRPMLNQHHVAVPAAVKARDHHGAGMHRVY